MSLNECQCLKNLQHGSERNLDSIPLPYPLKKKIDLKTLQIIIEGFIISWFFGEGGGEV